MWDYMIDLSPDRTVGIIGMLKVLFWIVSPFIGLQLIAILAVIIDNVLVGVGTKMPPLCFIGLHKWKIYAGGFVGGTCSPSGDGVDPHWVDDRFCTLCHKRVFNFSKLSKEERYTYS